MTTGRIGIAAYRVRVGVSGGIGIYTTNLVRALATHAPELPLTIIVDESDYALWAEQHWPPAFRVAPWHQVQPPAFLERSYRYIKRRAGLPVDVYGKEMQACRQLDRLNLSLLHFPTTTIFPLTTAIPSVLTFFDLQQEYYPKFFTKSELEARASQYPASVSKAQHVIASTEFTKQSLIKKYGTPREKISVIPGGVSADFKLPSRTASEEIRTKYSLPDSFFFYPANPWPHKNHARLMAALRILRDQQGHAPNLVLSGRLQNESRNAMLLALAAQVEEYVTDLGFVPSADLPAIYSAASGLVFPSLFEGLAIPLIEAMNCGCPIAAANSSCIPEIAGGAASLFDPFSPDEIAAAMSRIWHDTAYAARLVERGYTQLPRFEWKSIVDRLVTIYQRYR